MTQKNPRRGGAAGAVVKTVIQQNDNITPPSQFQPRDDTARSNTRGLEASVKRDRVFFRRHPFLSEYTREIMPGEFSPSIVPVPSGCEFQGLVKVRRITANLRTRTVLAAIVVPECE
jgi:hypothetical protein